MIRGDAVVVGGGPAGATCARTLSRAGWGVGVIDAAAFPRDKVCAGWLTPGVFPLLDLSPDEYRAAGLTLEAVTGFRTSVSGGPAITTDYGEVVSYAVRRCEFDDYLLRRSGARVIEKTPARTFERVGDDWVVNGAVSAPAATSARSRGICAAACRTSNPSSRKKRSSASATPRQGGPSIDRRSCSSAATCRATRGACGRESI